MKGRHAVKKFQRMFMSEQQMKTKTLSLVAALSLTLASVACTIQAPDAAQGQKSGSSGGPGASSDSSQSPGGSGSCDATQDGGASWETFREGLPQEHAYDVVYRHALDASEGRVCFGSTTGNLYMSEDRGETWSCLGNHFPPDPLRSVRLKCRRSRSLGTSKGSFRPSRRARSRARPCARSSTRSSDVTLASRRTSSTRPVSSAGT